MGIRDFCNDLGGGGAVYINHSKILDSDVCKVQTGLIYNGAVQYIALTVMSRGDVVL